MSSLMDHGEDKDFLIVSSIEDLKRKFFDTDLADIFFNDRSGQWVAGNLLKLISNAGEEFLAKSGSLNFVIALDTAKVGLHQWVEDDPLHRSVNNSSREIGLVFPAFKAS